MGCCASTGDIANQAGGGSKPMTFPSRGSRSSEHRNSASRGVDPSEAALEIILKVKRANVYTQGVSDEIQTNYEAKVIPKTEAQSKAIRDALDQNFIFASLGENEKKILSDAMEIVEFSSGANIITQGEEGDYFYILEKGTVAVIVEGTKVYSLVEGKSFGELALLYNLPRQATIQAEGDCRLYQLDRDTFKYSLAHSAAEKSQIIVDALSKVPLLKDLTKSQLSKISDSVEIIPFQANDTIVRKGAEGNVFYIIKEGKVRVTSIGDGKTYQDHDLGVGDFFGERALITGEPRHANVTATTKVVLMALDRVSFDLLLGPLKDLLDLNMKIRVVNNIHYFSRLKDEDRRKVSKAFKFEKFAANSSIIKEGEKGNKLYVLREGQLRSDAANTTSKVLTAGAYFGESALLEEETRKVTVVAVTDSEVFTLTRSDLKAIFKDKSSKESGKEETRVLTPVIPENSTLRPEIKISDLQDLRKTLGSGTFGKVSLVTHRTTKEVFALKAMLKSELVAHKQQNNVMNEKQVMLMCNHPFILKLYQTFKDAKRLYMLLEFVQGGELFAVLHTAHSDGVSDSQAKFYAAGVTLALEYLHNLDIAYRDLKPENCLIDRYGYPKLVDFGFAKILPSGKTYTLCGTPEYLAPELVLGRGHNKAVDCWALGILIYEMQAGQSPFCDPQNMDQVVICRNIVNGRLSFPRNFNADCKDLVKRLLVRETQSRLGNLRGGYADVRAHPWFSSIDFDKYTNYNIKSPWVPKIKSNTDVSNFDPYPADEHRDTGAVDTSNWDKNF